MLPPLVCVWGVSQGEVGTPVSQWVGSTLDKGQSGRHLSWPLSMKEGSGTRGPGGHRSRAWGR